MPTRIWWRAGSTPSSPRPVSAASRRWRTWSRPIRKGRLIAPDEIAQAVLYLCGPASGSVTGQSLTINGGEF
ncbi:MAG: hypothetical protein C0420_05010 [Methylobacterium sp.]|nr:hypothetical protein [Methylobacterium sp.]